MTLEEHAKVKAILDGLRPRAHVYAYFENHARRRVHAIGPSWITILRRGMIFRMDISKVLCLKAWQKGVWVPLPKVSSKTELSENSHA